jgi:hypothetical protein
MTMATLVLGGVAVMRWESRPPGTLSSSPEGAGTARASGTTLVAQRIAAPVFAASPEPTAAPVAASASATRAVASGHPPQRPPRRLAGGR